MEISPPREYKDVRFAVPWGDVVGRWYGNRAVRPILAVHGWLDNIGTWDTLIPLLPPHLGILCIDLPGHGQSSKYPKGIQYNVLDYVDIITRIVNEYKWQKVSLMGHSMGVNVIFIYTSLFPEKVDLVIAFDMLNPRQQDIKTEIDRMNTKIEKSLVEDERLDKLAMQEPPSYTYEELIDILYKGSRQSVERQNCKYILNRSITKSTKYPDKYYFSRDGKLKFYTEFVCSPPLDVEMAERIRNIPYFVVKATNSPYINEKSVDCFEVMRANNTRFELHVLEGTHHVHLNNAEMVAKLLNPFINRHRPAELNSWTIDQDYNEQNMDNQRRRLGKMQRIAKVLHKNVKNKL